MNGLRNQFLAGAAFAAYQYGFVSRRNLGDALAKILHYGARADHGRAWSRERGAWSVTLTVRSSSLLRAAGPLLAQPVAIACLSDAPFELHNIEWLFDVVERSVAHGLDGR